MKPLSRKAFLTTRVVFIVALVSIVAACEIDMTIEIDGKSPPTFKLSGNGNLDFFMVREVDSEKPKISSAQRNSQKDVVIWEIWPSNISYENRRIWKLQPITYGKVPQGFVQKIPANVDPPPLIEGKTYEAGGPASNANGGSIFFTIRNGSAVKLSEGE